MDRDQLALTVAEEAGEKARIDESRDLQYLASEGAQEGAEEDNQ